MAIRIRDIKPISLRLDDNLRKAVEKRAEDAGQSVNAALIEIIKAGLGVLPEVTTTEQRFAELEQRIAIIEAKLNVDDT